MTKLLVVFVIFFLLTCKMRVILWIWAITDEVFYQLLEVFYAEEEVVGCC